MNNIKHLFCILTAMIACVAMAKGGGGGHGGGGNRPMNGGGRGGGMRPATFNQGARNIAKPSAPRQPAVNRGRSAAPKGGHVAKPKDNGRKPARVEMHGGHNRIGCGIRPHHHPPLFGWREHHDAWLYWERPPIPVAIANAVYGWVWIVDAWTYAIDGTTYYGDGYYYDGYNYYYAGRHFRVPPPGCTIPVVYIGNR